MDQGLDAKIEELREAINKFLLATKDEDGEQVGNISGTLQSLLHSDCMRMSEEEYNETYSSYYESMC